MISGHKCSSLFLKNCLQNIDDITYFVNIQIVWQMTYAYSQYFTKYACMPLFLNYFKIEKEYD